MTNQELQHAINKTIEHINLETSCSLLYFDLKSHLETLLKTQAKRAEES